MQLATFRRRGLPVLVAGALALTVGVTAPSASGAPTAVRAAVAPAPSDPAAPMILGVAGGQLPTKTTTRLDTFQSKAGRPVGVVRMYGLWNSTFPDALSSSAKSHGQLILLSVKAKTSTGAAVPWASIANSKPGDANYAQILRWANALKAWGDPIFFSFNHEAEEASNDRQGSAADFIAAWRKIVTVFRDQGVSNAEYVFISTAFGYQRSDRRNAKNYYPGDDYVDDIGADGYNWFTCRANAKIGWQSPTTLFGGFKTFGAAHPQKGMVIAEFGSVEDPAQPGRKAQWFDDLRSMFKQPGYGQFRIAAEWYSQSTGGCNFTIDSSASALSAFQGLGQDPQYGASAVIPATVRQVTASRLSAGSAKVQWAPAGPGGSPVMSYTVTVVPTGETFTVDGSASSFTYQPTSGTGSYSFTVAATNAVGSSNPSSPTAAVSVT
jgi:hypothetical protein